MTNNTNSTYTNVACTTHSHINCSDESVQCPSTCFGFSCVLLHKRFAAFDMRLFTRTWLLDLCNPWLNGQETEFLADALAVRDPRAWRQMRRENGEIAQERCQTTGKQKHDVGFLGRTLPKHAEGHELIAIELRIKSGMLFGHMHLLNHGHAPLMLAPLLGRGPLLWGV